MNVFAEAVLWMLRIMAISVGISFVVLAPVFLVVLGSRSPTVNRILRLLRQ